MAIQVGSYNDSHSTMHDMNTTPLIDVMLVLLVMLIITIPLQTHATKLDMPIDRPQTETPQVINLSFDFDGTPLWNGTPVSSQAKLERYFANVASQSPQPEIHVIPGHLTKYDVVARVLADAQRLGVTKMGFAGNKQ